MGRNADKFDSKHLWRIIHTNKITDDFSSLIGFIDTLPLCRSLKPQEKTHRQEAVYERVIGGKYNAHNAMGDIVALTDILKKLVGTKPSTYYHNYSLSSEYVSKRHEHLLIRSSNLPSLQVLIQNNVLSESMAKKIADSGLNYSHIKLAYDRNGDDGIKDLFTEKFFLLVLY